MPKHQYATVMAPGTKKVSVCARRVGSRDRLAVIAVCNNGDVAENIVDALNTQQGDIVKLDTPALRQVEQLRNDIAAERKRADEYHCKLSEKDSELRKVKRELADTTRTVDKLERELDRLNTKLAADRSKEDA